MKLNLISITLRQLMTILERVEPKALLLDGTNETAPLANH